jgi:hypothetical protein
MAPVQCVSAPLKNQRSVGVIIDPAEVKIQEKSLELESIRAKAALVKDTKT